MVTDLVDAEVALKPYRTCHPAECCVAQRWLQNCVREREPSIPVARKRYKRKGNGLRQTRETSALAVRNGALSEAWTGSCFETDRADVKIVSALRRESRRNPGSGARFAVQRRLR